MTAATARVQASHSLVDTNGIEQLTSRRQHHSGQKVETLFAFLASTHCIPSHGNLSRFYLAVRGANTNPRTAPENNPQRCAAMLTCGVERSNAVCIATIISTLPNRCFACGACRCRSKNPAHAPTIPMMHPEAPTSWAT